jgi:hypothetical protein
MPIMIDLGLHHVARVAAAVKKQSLNEWVCDAVRDAILRQADEPDGEPVTAMMKRLGVLRQVA